MELAIDSEKLCQFIESVVICLFTDLGLLVDSLTQDINLVIWIIFYLLTSQLYSY